VCPRLARVITASVIRNHPNALSPRIKSLNYLNNILAKMEAVDAGVSDMEYELGFLVEHLSSRSTNWSPLLEACAPDEQRLRAARLTSAAHWLLLLLPGQPAARRNPPSALDQQAQRILSLAGR